ncbi:MAG: IclR family transcriptional regulator [Planctomycetia bacterium]|nr:IclR family transcriptional regulator [Planctomycetia bacterium]
MAVKQQNNYHVPGLAKGIDLIKLLCDARNPLSLTEISQAMDLNKHMVFRLLQTLIREGWVIAESEGPRYRMSLVPFYHTSKPINHSNLVQMATEPMQRYWQEIGESTSLGILDEDRVLYVVHLNSTKDVAVIGHAGRKYYLHAAAAGKVLLAYADEHYQEKIISQGLPQLTLQTITSPAKLREELESVRKSEFALDREEYAKGVICFAAPIRDYSGKVVAAMNTSVLAMNYTFAEFEQIIGTRVMDTCRIISQSLGYHLV